MNRHTGAYQALWGVGGRAETVLLNWWYLDIRDRICSQSWPDDDRAPQIETLISAVTRWCSKRQMTACALHRQVHQCLWLQISMFRMSHLNLQPQSLVFPKNFCWCSTAESLYSHEHFSLDVWEEKAKPFRLMCSKWFCKFWNEQMQNLLYKVWSNILQLL